MSTNRTEEDWFLRGGERPKKEDEQSPVVTCQNCGGDNLADEECCTHCGAALRGGVSTGEYCGDDGDGELRLYEVEVTQTKTVTQTATIRVRATSEDAAMDLVEERAAIGDLEVTDLDWADVEDSDEYDDFTVEDAVEAEET